MSPGWMKPATPWLESTEIVIAWLPFGTFDREAADRRGLRRTTR